MIMVGLTYFIVIVLASIVGAIVGLGGGVIIRPIFDALGYHNVLNIGFFTSSSIVTMALVSTWRKVKAGMQVDVKLVLFIAFGAIAGGSIGNLILEHVVYTLGGTTANQAQTVLTIIVLFFSIFATDIKHRFSINSNLVCLLLGVLLGCISTFLGIGGGPVNVPLMIIFFSMPMKDATTYSIIIIFFAHMSRLITLGTGGHELEFEMLPFVIVAAAIGGIIGTKVSGILSDNHVKIVYKATLVAIIIMNITNLVFFI